MKKRLALIIFFLMIILPLVTAITIKPRTSVTGETVTGETITGGAAAEPTNVSITVLTSIPQITNIASSAAATSAAITWNTDRAANSSVYYGTTKATTSFSASANLVTSHSITLSSLSSSALYYYNTSSCDAVGNCNTSTQNNFTTSSEEVTPLPGGGGGGETAETKSIDIDTEKIKIKLKQGQTKQQELVIKNTGDVKLSISLQNPKLKKLMTVSEESFDLDAGESKTITLEFEAKEDTKPDLYAGKLTIKADGIEKEVSIAVEVETKKPLLDVKLEIPLRYLIIMPGEKILANGIIYNLGETKKIDISIEYAIKDAEDFILVREQETIAIEKELSIMKTFEIPKEAKYGDYIFYAKVTYNGETAIASAWFKISRKPFFRLENILIMIVILIIITLLAIIYELRRLSKHIRTKIDENVLLKEKLIKLKGGK